MKAKICLSLMSAVFLNAVDLGTIEVEKVTDVKVLENVSNEEVKKADLAEFLHKKIPSVNLIRRSAIANDITLRGLKRDNIVVTADSSRVYGACPNRMDPPTSHIVIENIQDVRVSEGPFDVEEFGNLGGSVKVDTLKPSKKLKGEVEFTLGSFDYVKSAVKVSGGNDKVRVVASGSIQSANQYKDGDGNTLAEQLANAVNGTAQEAMKYAPQYEDMKAYDKKSGMIKTFIKVKENQDLELSYTANRSDDVLYPNSKMDALYDDSNIYNLKYTIKDLGEYSKKLTIKAYKSDVTHPMSTKYRLSSGPNSVNEVISKLTTDTKGLKVLNDIDVNEGVLTLGVDTSKRNWDGVYIGYGAKAGITGRKSIDDVDTINKAILAKYTKGFDNLNLQFGLRYNDTKITTANSVYDDRKFYSLDANVIATLQGSNNFKYFVALGQASRVPDARELYFNSSMNVQSGTPTLDQTTNKEVDVGLERVTDSSYFKLKGFYSKLDDYIYFNKSNVKVLPNGAKAAYHAFENIDAKIYGVELVGSTDLTDEVYVDYGASYQRGKKDEPLTGQTNTNLADIPPFKMNLALNYETNNLLATLEFIHANTWDKYDDENGEQRIPSYNVVNVKVKKEFSKNFETTIGVDNIFDETYAVSNTYADLILLSDGTTGNVMLLNEPGRYFYLNLKYKF